MRKIYIFELKEICLLNILQKICLELHSLIQFGMSKFYLHNIKKSKHGRPISTGPNIELIKK